MKVRDIIFTPEFYSDWEFLPPNIKNTFNKKIIKILDHGEILGSFNAHKVDLIDNPVMYIGYVNIGNGGYRVLYEEGSSGVICFLRILSHERMEKVLHTIVKYA